MSFRDANRFHNCTNPNQGDFKKVLCVCSAGLLRSPTTAVVLSQEPFQYNTRAVGCVPDYALVPLEQVHVHWANEIVFMTQEHADYVTATHHIRDDQKIVILDIEDNYPYRDPELVELIKERYIERAN